MPELRYYLMCPMQCRANNVVVNDCPKIHVPNSDYESHAVNTLDEYGDNVIIPFHVNGVTSLFHTEAFTKKNLVHMPIRESS